MITPGEPPGGRKIPRLAEAGIVSACLISALAYLAFSEGIRNHFASLWDAVDRFLSLVGAR